MDPDGSCSGAELVGQVHKHMTEAELLALFRKVAAVDEVTVTLEKPPRFPEVSTRSDLGWPRVVLLLFVFGGDDVGGI